MTKRALHPGVYLNKMLENKGLSQRDLASKIDIAHSLLNNILKGNRNININIAFSLEAIEFKDANYWLTAQKDYSLQEAKNDRKLIKKSNSIKSWNELAEIVPISFFRKQDLDIDSSEDIAKIYSIYGVKDLNSLRNKIESFNPTYFRKSSKFLENRNNVLAWSQLAEYKVKNQKVNLFNSSNQNLLVEELKKCFYKNSDTIKKTKKILNKYGIKFFILDRPSETPVDGKSFMSGKNPAIILSLKYKRLDNFAFTIMHELGHVFLHLTNPKFKDSNFFINSSNSNIEFEADTFARDNLIDLSLWDDFILLNYEFTDDIILEFSKKTKVHPGIIRGRVCFEYNEYYRKRSLIKIRNILNFLDS